MSSVLRFPKGYFYFSKLYLLILLCLMVSGDVQGNAGGDWSSFFVPSGQVPDLGGSSSGAFSTSQVILRGKNLLALQAQSGVSFSVTLNGYKISSYTDAVDWQLRSRDMTVLASGSFAYNGSDTVSYTHNKSEMLYLCVDSQASGVKISSSDVPVGVMASAKRHFFVSTDKYLYLTVPERVSSFSLTMYSSSTSENVKINVYRPDDTLAVSDETSDTEQTVTMSVDVGEDDNSVWKIQICEPSVGRLEDFYLKLDADIPPVLGVAGECSFSYVPFGVSEKLAVMVDKVMAGSTSYQHAEWMVQAAKNAGFNIYVARKFYGDNGEYVSDLDQLEELADWCGQNDMKTLVWIRGTLEVALNDSSADGKRYLPDTTEAPLWSPNSDELWEHLAEWIVAYAESSVDYPAIEGVFLDLENYSGVNVPSFMCYHPSYDDVITTEFECEYNVTIPVADSERKAWLVTNNLHDEFVEFQLERWNQRCKELREAVDEVNPRFRFFVYPFGYMKNNKNPEFLCDPVAPIRQFSSAQAPLVHADVQCYTPAYTAVHGAWSHAYRNRVRLDWEKDIADSQDVPYMLLAGMDPVSCEEQRGYNARTAVLGAEEANGFWVFYEGPDFPSDEHTIQMNEFSWAAQQISAENYSAAETSYTYLRSWDSLFENGAAPSLSGPSPFGAYSPGTCMLRGTNIYVLSCQAGTLAYARLQTTSVGSYDDAPIAFEVRPLSDLSTRVYHSHLMTNQSGFVAFYPGSTGIYLLAAGSENHAVNLALTNVPAGIYAGKKAHFFTNTSTLYANAPSGTSDFDIVLTSSGSEYVKVGIYDPASVMRYQPQTSATYPQLTQSVDCSLYGTGRWKLIPGAAATGAFEDYYLKISGAPPVLGLHQNALFGY